MFWADKCQKNRSVISVKIQKCQILNIIMIELDVFLFFSWYMSFKNVMLEAARLARYFVKLIAQPISFCIMLKPSNFISDCDLKWRSRYIGHNVYFFVVTSLVSQCVEHPYVLFFFIDWYCHLQVRCWHFLVYIYAMKYICMDLDTIHDLPCITMTESFMSTLINLQDAMMLKMNANYGISYLRKVWLDTLKETCELQKY